MSFFVMPAGFERVDSQMRRMRVIRRKMEIERVEALDAENQAIRKVEEDAFRRNMATSSHEVWRRHEQRAATLRRLLGRRVALEGEVPADEEPWYDALVEDITRLVEDEERRQLDELHADWRRFMRGDAPEHDIRRAREANNRFRGEFQMRAEIMRDERALSGGRDDPNQQRLRVLRAVRDISGGNKDWMVARADVASRTGLSEEAVGRALDILVDLGFLNDKGGMGNPLPGPTHVAITTRGILTAEQGRLGAAPAVAPTVVNLNIDRSQVANLSLGPILGDIQAVVGRLQQGESGHQTFANALKALTEAIANNAILGDQEKREAVELVVSVSEEIARPEPRPAPLRAAWMALGTVLARAPEVYALYALTRAAAKELGIDLP